MRTDSPRKWEDVQSLLRQRILLEKLAARKDEKADDENAVRPGAIWWVAQAFQYAAFRSEADVSARALCAALRDYVRVEFKSETTAAAALARVGIRSSEDVGRVVCAMVVEGMLRRSKDDSIADFEGLFTLDNLFVVEL